MNRLRLISVMLSCVVLALPVSAVTRCCCTARSQVDNSDRSIQSEHRQCCQSSVKVDDCCVRNKAVGWDTACNCSVCLSAWVFLPTSVKTWTTYLLASNLPADEYLAPFLSISLSSRLDRPAITHNQSQAMLCVWRN